MTDASEEDRREMLRQVRRIQVRTDRMVTDVMAGGYTSVFRGSGIEPSAEEERQSSHHERHR